MALRPRELFTNLGLLALRAGFGLQMAAFHGLDKLRTFSERAGSFPDPLGIGHRNSLLVTVTAEFFCAALLVVGLASRLAALTLSLVMGVAVFVQQAPEPWRNKELAALYFERLFDHALPGPGQTVAGRDPAAAAVQARRRRRPGVGRAHAAGVAVAAGSERPALQLDSAVNRVCRGAGASTGR